jgi:hypothetical protein
MACQPTNRCLCAAIDVARVTVRPDIAGRFGTPTNWASRLQPRHPVICSSRIASRTFSAISGGR